LDGETLWLLNDVVSELTQPGLWVGHSCPTLFGFDFLFELGQSVAGE